MSNIDPQVVSLEQVPIIEPDINILLSDEKIDALFTQKVKQVLEE